ncbi:MAG: histidinol-phosphatase [Actinobacteria bacterium]|nr:histidinol-phosphatase [Actinomycetota bacterium]
MEDHLRFAHELADLADGVTLPAFRDGVEVQRKADGTAVTEADRGAERAMRAAIAERHPDHAILGEEDGRQGPQDAPTWILDPIDGTNNFTRGLPVYATLIALAVDHRPVLGVVSAPALGSRWDGIVGQGARQDGRDIRVSETEDLGSATVSFGGLNYFDERGSQAIVDRIARNSRRQRGFGDFWQHCLVASGAIDVAVEAHVSRWDLAAVKAVVEAAGGRLTSLEGEDTDDGGSALTSNGVLHDPLLELIHR